MRKKIIGVLFVIVICFIGGMYWNHTKIESKKILSENSTDASQIRREKDTEKKIMKKQQRLFQLI